MFVIYSLIVNNLNIFNYKLINIFFTTIFKKRLNFTKDNYFNILNFLKLTLYNIIL